MTDGTPTESPRKPRVALMGEFSAGKSTLANLLLGQDSSPVQVTATQLPPVWYRQGAPEARRIATDGEAENLPVDDWSEVRPDGTRLISVALNADILYACDLIDMPGTADPNMTSDVWSDFLPQVDLAIWCTPANQAWRQSEVALWEQVPPLLWTKSLLLVTRIDQMKTERDRARVMARVRGEAGALFREVLPISLTGALAGRNDDETLQASGAAALVQFLCTALEGLDAAHPRVTGPADLPRRVPKAPAFATAQDGGRPARVVPRRIARSKAQRGRSGSENRSI